MTTSNKQKKIKELDKNTTIRNITDSSIFLFN